MSSIFIFIAPFIFSFNRFLSLALINKASYKQFYTYMANLVDLGENVYSRRTWICITTCQSCNLNEDFMSQLNYKIDNPPRRCLVCCDYWKCRLNCFIYYLRELAVRDKIFLFKPPITGIINIPRTDPLKKTKGQLFSFWEGTAAYKDGNFFIKVEWTEKENHWEKYINFKDFLKLNPQFKKCHMRNIYSFNLKTKEIADTFP